MKIGAALLVALLQSTQLSAPPPQPDDLAIWREFSAFVQKGDFPRDRIKPTVPGAEDDLLRFLGALRGVAPAAWERVPEVVRNGSTLNFVIPLSDDSRPFNFTFLVENGRWFFQHLEQVMLRLDRTPPPPTADFPDTVEERKAWARDEIYWSQIVSLHSRLVPKIGASAFLDLLRDGAGYALNARTWVPFVSPERAFILYLCWDLARLHGMNTRGNCVVLEALDERTAVVRLRDHPYFRLYQVASHIRPQIAFADYREMFETIWTDRARAAGWRLAVDYRSPDGLDIVLRFSRSGSDS